MAIQHEKAFEAEICEYLADHGWAYRDVLPFDEGYDKASALYLPDLYGWLYDTQPDALAKLVRSGATAAAGAPVDNVLGEFAPAAPRIRERVVKLLGTDPLAGGGTLNVLKNPVDVTPARFSLFQARPATPLNPELNQRYAANRLRVVRQVHYSTRSENSIDLVLFLNGVPVATVELKTELTQSLRAGLSQYARDRRPVGEPLLEFGRGALVHFVVTEEWVRMTTRLESSNTKFLPFDRGRDNGEGNPPIPGTAPTAFLWQETLQRDTFLDLIGRFARYVRDERTDASGKKTVDVALRFPRYHQWRAVTKLEAAALAEGPGHNYLIQHSAGSGKTDSIAWTAHRLATLHRPDGSKVFDGVIVVTDRKVLDTQLRKAVEGLQTRAGQFVAVADGQGEAKSKQLTDALTRGEAIIGVTLQTFPFALEVLRDSPALSARNYAVVADEAHSSQSGEAAKKLREVLAVPAQDLGDDPDASVDMEDVLAAVMAARAEQRSISFFAFTATPKGKTLELFGRPGPTGRPEPFDLYSMKQAIQEGFILDVLRNYMSYDLAFRLATRNAAGASVTVDQAQANAQVMRWVRLHPYNIAQKVAVIVDHYLNVVAGELGGRAKAMVVTGSRKEAVRYKIAIDKYLADNGLATQCAALVAFSGTVTDPGSAPGEFTETSMNPGAKGRALEDAFGTDAYQLMIVANKFQTGFDQPLLVAMYVDKKLSGITAVQTLSRLNRVFPGKANTYVLDFVNDPAQILEAFQDYYEDAVLFQPSDPDIVHDMLTKIRAAGIIDVAEIDPVVEEVQKQGSHNRLYSLVKTSRDRFYDRLRTARETDDKTEQAALADFRATVNNFVRAYDFLSQIINYGSADIEKWSIFCKVYRGAIRDDQPRDEIDTSDVVMTHYKLTKASEGPLTLAPGQQGQLSGVTAVGSGSVRATKYGLLEEVLARINDLFTGSDLDEVDRANAVLSVFNHATNSTRLQAEAMANSATDFASSPSIIEELEDIPYRADMGHQAAIKYLITTGKYRQLAEALLAQGLYEALRQAARKDESD